MLTASSALGALSDPLRIRTVRLLAKEPLQVRELQRVVGAAQSRISNHLAVLRRAGLVETARSGGAERYVPTPEGRSLWDTLSGVLTDPAFAADDVRLADVLRSALPRRPGRASTRSRAPGTGSRPRSTPRESAALVRLVPPGLTVADVGCGTGLLTLTLAGVASRVLAVDESPEMVRKTREKVRLAKLPNVEVRRGKAEALPFASGSCDALFAFHLLRHIPRPADAAAEFARVLRPGGRIVLVELEPHGVRALRAATGSVHLGLPRETVRAALRRSGFGALRFEALPEPYRVAADGAPDALSLRAYIADGVRARADASTKRTKTIIRKERP